MAKPRRRRASGSLASLKKALWATILYNLDVIEDRALDHDVKQRACNSLTQAALTFAKMVDLLEVQRRVADLEVPVTNGHGEHP